MIPDFPKDAIPAMDAKYRCDEILPMFRYDAMEDLKGLKFYLETLENFIDNERTREISELEPHKDHWEQIHREDFWAWYYPVHWEDIFASRIRSSFIIALISLAELHLGMVADQFSEISAINIKAGDLNGTHFQKHRKYLEKLVGFTRPAGGNWDSLDEIYAIRNSIVHANGVIYYSPRQKQKRLRLLVEKLPGLEAQNDVIEFTAEFPLHAFKVVEEFVTGLYDEATVFCQKLNPA